ncbi:MAG: potassium channel family protein [Candidatus Berkelbacteria bacterium]|nr:potassium channel family protein [Candidatus Berkelbacteria bacterium]
MLTKKRKRLLLALSLVFFYLVLGTLIFSYFENWSMVDSFYFSTSTLMTLGYGDFVPTHSITKILTSIFALASAPVILFALSILAENYFRKTLSLLSKEHLEEEIQKILSLINRREDTTEKNLKKEIEEFNSSKS